MHHGPDDVARPPTIKQDELKQLDVGEEEEGGWAGHHEEVDYTQEVVFSDSSDEVCVCVCVRVRVHQFLGMLVLESVLGIHPIYQ